MEILDIINSRRNTKSFKPDMITTEQLHKWLKAGSMAPNHKMTEPWQIVMVGAETRAKLNHKTDFFSAPVVFAVLSKHGSTEIERYENLLTTACFVQNVNLAAWAEGVGTFWCSMGYNDKNREILGVGENYDVVGLFGIGYVDEVPEAKKRTAIEEKITVLP